MKKTLELTPAESVALNGIHFQYLKSEEEARAILAKAEQVRNRQILLALKDRVAQIDASKLMFMEPHTEGDFQGYPRAFIYDDGVAEPAKSEAKAE